MRIILIGPVCEYHSGRSRPSVATMFETSSVYQTRYAPVARANTTKRLRASSISTAADEKTAAQSSVISTKHVQANPAFLPQWLSLDSP